MQYSKNNMKKFILLITLLLVPVTMFCQKNEWTEVQTVVVPDGTPLYHYYTNTGNVKYVLSIKDMNIPVSTSNADGYLSGAYKLEIVKWYSPITNKYKYTTRRYKPSQKDIDLQTVFGNDSKPTTFFKPSLNEYKTHYNPSDD